MTPDVLIWIVLGLTFTVGRSLIMNVIYGRQLGRSLARRRHAAETERIAEAQVAAWRSERRARRATELRRWDAAFAALLPPPPPCTSTEHNHVENIRLGSGTIEQICVIRPPYASGGAVLAPGEHVVSLRDTAYQLGVGGITVEEALAAMRRLAR